MKLSEHAIHAMGVWDTFIPQHLQQSVIAYIEQGHGVDSFLAAIICNDLQKTVANCHAGLLVCIPPIARWFFNHAPINCHGDENKYYGWMDSFKREESA